MLQAAGWSAWHFEQFGLLLLHVQPSASHGVGICGRWLSSSNPPLAHAFCIGRKTTALGSAPAAAPVLL